MSVTCHVTSVNRKFRAKFQDSKGSLYPGRIGESQTAVGFLEADPDMVAGPRHPKKSAGLDGLCRYPTDDPRSAPILWACLRSATCTTRIATDLARQPFCAGNRPRPTLHCCGRAIAALNNIIERQLQSQPDAEGASFQGFD